MFSLKEALRFVGLEHGTAVPSGIPGTRPRSLRELITSCQDPQGGVDEPTTR
jgi:hypothetical protein